MTPKRVSTQLFGMLALWHPLMRQIMRSLL